jgi:hypothetical protein
MACLGPCGATTQPFVEPPTSLHSGYCSKLRQHYQKKSSIKGAKLPPCPSEAEEKDLLESERLKAVENLQKYQDKTRSWRNLKVKKRDFDVSNLVLLWSPHTESSSKLKSKWEEPYVIIKKTRPEAYRLMDPQGPKLEHSWNADNLHRFYI